MAQKSDTIHASSEQENVTGLSTSHLAVFFFNKFLINLFITVLALHCCRGPFSAAAATPLQPHGIQQTGLPCPSPSPEVCSNSCPPSQRYPPVISSSVTPFSWPQSFPASGSFLMSRLFASGGSSTEASASVLPMNIQG